jgi:hypothetical protein
MYYMAFTSMISNTFEAIKKAPLGSLSSSEPEKQNSAGGFLFGFLVPE